MSKPIIGIASDVVHREGERDQAFVFTAYVESVKRAGAIPLLIPPQPENARDVLERVDGILLAGGDDCDPAEYGEERHSSCAPMDSRRQRNDIRLAALARESGIPTLGICLGMQMMNVAAGGTLIQDIESAVETEIEHASDPMDRNRHDVMVDGATNLGRIVGAQELNVNSSHHQAVGRVAEGLRANSQAPDGIVEGIEDPSHPFYLGVQWHPEDMPGEASATALFGAFVEAARTYAARKENASTEMSPVSAVQSE
jgi:Predicted glutamine amidotransferases